MQDSIPYLLSKLEQDGTTEKDLISFESMLTNRVNRGMMSGELFNELMSYVNQLKERIEDE